MSLDTHLGAGDGTPRMVEDGLLLRYVAHFTTCPNADEWRTW